MNQRILSAQNIVDNLYTKLPNIPSTDYEIWSDDSGLPNIAGTNNNSMISLAISNPNSYQNLFDNVNKLLNEASKRKIFASISQDLKMDQIEYKLDVDLYKMSLINVDLNQIAKTMEIFFSYDKSFSFLKDMIYYPITISAKTMPWSINELYVVSPNGTQISIGALGALKMTSGPKKLYHLNQIGSTIVKAQLNDGDSLQNGMTKLMTLADEILPKYLKKTWVGNSNDYIESQKSIILLFSLSIIFIFAILSVQFQNFLDPIIIIISIPLSIVGGLLLIYLSDQSFNIYTQVGIVTLIALITKHGILIVDFANELYKKNNSYLESIILAAKLRLRPIIMTSLAMILGSIPLILFKESGYEARRAIGTILVGGIGFGTLLTLFILPSIYLMVKHINR
jgi:multidrug efflux pump